MSFSSPEQWGFPWWIANSPSCLPCQLIGSRPAWPSLSVHFLWLGPSSTNTWVIRQHFLVSNFLAPPSPILACVAGTTSITSNSTNIVELSRGIAAISQESTDFKSFQELWVTNFWPRKPQLSVEPIGHNDHLGDFTILWMPSLKAALARATSDWKPSRRDQSGSMDQCLLVGWWVVWPWWWRQDTACGSQVELDSDYLPVLLLPVCLTVCAPTDYNSPTGAQLLSSALYCDVSAGPALQQHLHHHIMQLFPAFTIFWLKTCDSFYEQ